MTQLDPSDVNIMLLHMKSDSPGCMFPAWVWPLCLCYHTLRKVVLWLIPRALSHSVAVAYLFGFFYMQLLLALIFWWHSHTNEPFSQLNNCRVLWSCTSILCFPLLAKAKFHNQWGHESTSCRYMSIAFISMITLHVGLIIYIFI